MGAIYSKEDYNYLHNQAYSESSWVPIFGLQKHIAPLFTEPAWHFSNPLNLPLFGYHLITPFSDQIAKKFTNEQLLEYSNLIKNLYINNNMHRINLPSLAPETINRNNRSNDQQDWKEPLPSGVHHINQFHLHAEQYQNFEAIDHLLITLPFPLMNISGFFSKDGPLYNINTPNTLNYVGREHYYYNSSSYTFPRGTQWDQYKYAGFKIKNFKKSSRSRFLFTFITSPTTQLRCRYLAYGGVQI
jgi:hypothetical protein